MKRNFILAGALAIVTFFWIWFFKALGAEAYWLALISFGIYLASGAVASKLPWMVLGGVVGVILGFLTFALAMLIFPTYATISIAISGAIFILIGALISVPKLYEMLPMYLVGWAGFLGGMARFDYLIVEKAVEGLPRATHTFVGVILSVLVGLLFGALLGTPILKMGEKKVATGQIEQGG